MFRTPSHRRGIWGNLVNLPQVFHGVVTPVFSISNDILFKEITSPFEVGRYHSWVIDPASLPEEIQVTAVDEHNNIMGLSHKTLNIKGVQFHPESIMTPMGKKIIENWLSL
jgi:anthranilate synthase component 2